MYGSGLTLAQELSIKTAAKAESQPCPHCESLQSEDRLDAWKQARYRPADIDKEHLEGFAKAFSQNVPQGWNKRAANYPYVPNGNGSLKYGRRDGGNWNREDFSDQVRMEAVWSSGKIRLVSMYSGHNVEVLTPLHQALYACLKRRNWLLVGSPTGERLRYLQAGCRGTEWLSFDYIGATDNIKTAYVQRAVEILIDKGEGLVEEEVRCLRVFAGLRLGEDTGVVESGQPMGSPMSFPVLCLINKAIVDLSLTDLLIEGKIPFKEWTGHRCLINGDDLLTRDVSSGSLAERIYINGRKVGMETNPTKTLRDPEIGEINSTVFKNCVEQKKTNVSALWMTREVSDALGYADEAACTTRGFLQIALANRSRLARQKIKTVGGLPFDRIQALAASRQLKEALFSSPSAELPEDTNLFPVVAVPDGYDLSREEEVAATLERVREVREKRLFEGLAVRKQAATKQRKKIGISPPKERPRKGVVALLRRKTNGVEDHVLSIFARRWEQKRKEDLLAAEMVGVEPLTIVSDLSRVEACLDEIKAFKDKRKGSQAHTPPTTTSTFDLSLHRESEIVRLRCRPLLDLSEDEEDSGYVSLTDE